MEELENWEIRRKMTRFSRPTESIFSAFWIWRLVLKVKNRKPVKIPNSWSLQSIHNSVNLPVKLNFVPLKLFLSSRHALQLSLWKPAEKKCIQENYQHLHIFCSRGIMAREGKIAKIKQTLRLSNDGCEVWCWTCKGNNCVHVKHELSWNLKL
jgi:hypothetical protein